MKSRYSQTLAFALAVLMVTGGFAVTITIVSADTTETVSWTNNTELTAGGTTSVTVSSGTVELNTTPTTGLVSEYRFEGDLSDSAGGHNLTATGDGSGLSHTTGQYGTDLALDGTEATAVNTTAHHGLGDYTVSAWTKNGTTGDFIIAQRADNGGSTVQFAVKINSNGNAKITIYDSGAGSWVSASGTTAINDSNWHHVALKYDGSTAILYVDGNKEASASVSSPYGGEATTRVGATTDGTSLVGLHQGEIDDARVYSTALSKSEIQSLASTKWDGSSKTSEKAFSEAVTPNVTANYTLHGQTLNVTVIGSPGTSSEEKHTVTLDGNSTYDIAWAEAHGNYTVQTNYSSVNPAEQPLVKGLELAASISSSSSDSTETTYPLISIQRSVDGVYAIGGEEFVSASAKTTTEGDKTTFYVEGFFNTSNVSAENASIALPKPETSEQSIEVSFADENGVPLNSTTNVTLIGNYSSDSLFYYGDKKPITRDSSFNQYGNITVKNGTTYINTTSNSDGRLHVTVKANPTWFDHLAYDIRKLLVSNGISTE